MQYITFRLQTDCNQTFHPHLFPLNTFYTSYTFRDMEAADRSGCKGILFGERQDLVSEILECMNPISAVKNNTPMILKK